MKSRFSKVSLSRDADTRVASEMLSSRVSLGAHESCPNRLQFVQRHTINAGSSNSGLPSFGCFSWLLLALLALFFSLAGFSSLSPLRWYLRSLESSSKYPLKSSLVCNETDRNLGKCPLNYSLCLPLKAMK